MALTAWCSQRAKALFGDGIKALFSANMTKKYAHNGPHGTRWVSVTTSELALNQKSSRFRCSESCTSGAIWGPQLPSGVLQVLFATLARERADLRVYLYIANEGLLSRDIFMLPKPIS